MLIAHLSDLHLYHFPEWSGLRTKRLLGLVNLHVMRRLSRFNPDIARSAVASVLADSPDVVVISGDLTAMGSAAEFVLARDLLTPVLSRIPTVIVPGNHDYYTAQAACGARIEHYFAPYMRTAGAPIDAPVYPAVHFFGDVVIIGLNPNQYSITSAGRIDPAEAERLEGLLLRNDVQNCFKILVQHYPLFNHRGEVPSQFWRRLENREILMDVMERQPVGMVLHGHDHFRYSNVLTSDPNHLTHVYNAGSAAFDRGFDDPVRATYNLYEIKGKELVRVVFKDYSPEGFRSSYDGPPVEPRREPSSPVAAY